MHRTSTPRPRAAARRLVFLTLLGALLVLSLAQAAPALAAGSFTGGAKDGDYPRYIANDHTVYALRFDASDLDPLTTYNVKVRISPTDSISGGTSRGFTWSPGGPEWVQERDEWAKLPAFTTDAAGLYTDNEWVFFKFGDTTKPAVGGSGTWYLFVSVKPVGGGDKTTLNSATSRAVKLVDMTGRLTWATSAFRVHNGTPVGVNKSQRVDAVAAGTDTDYFAVMRTEPSQVERGYGSTAKGDFDIAVPVGMAFDVDVHSSDPVWLVEDFTGTLADVDVALGADDTTPPSAPDGFASTIEGTTAHLSWDAVADAASYTVYQWQDPTPIDGAINYTSQPLPVGTTSGTTYDVTGLAEGETYHFQVRAVDAATNVGPPSYYPVDLTVAASAKVVGWGRQATLTGALTDGAEPFAEGRIVTVQSSTDGGATWADIGEYDLDKLAGYGVTPAQKARYRLVFAGDSLHQTADSNVVTVAPKVKLGKPSAPLKVRKRAKFTASGTIAPKQTKGARNVRIKCYLKKGGKWRYVKAVRAVNKRTTRYAATFSLPSRGTWRLVAEYKANAKYATTTSGAEYLRVK
jgi:hypothetical protein